MMRTISGRILTTLGWRIRGGYPDIKKSVIIVAPHTSNWDIVLGKLYMKEIGVKNYVLVKKELFFFPLDLLLKAYGTIPVDRKDKNNNVVYQAASLFDKNDEFCLIISAEGTRKRVTNWKKGFVYIAQKANVPIIVSYLDYKKKEIGIKHIIRETSDMKETMEEINRIYKDVNPRYPEKFALDKKYS